MKIPPRQCFANLPTPIEELPHLSAKLNGPHIFVKRDDLTGLGLGGNKTRKLEFLIAEALANGAHTLITTGAIQSNHCRQTAAAAARFGLDCILVLTGEAPDRATGNLLLDCLFGAEITWTNQLRRDQTLKTTFDQAWEHGRRPYLVPYGGSSPTGATAYAIAMQELMSQQSNIDWIVFASSSGGTQAGLVTGARLFKYSGRVLGISVDEPQSVLQRRVANLAIATADFMGEKMIFSDDDILVNADYLGDGYGILGNSEREAINLFARHEGLLLDPVYTGRAAAGMIGLIRQGFFNPNENVLFWHTGGAPALFAERYQDLGKLRSGS
jgi:D-cysteine desulfhydrase family pyridoxal phosphate-dependent enzyme